MFKVGGKCVCINPLGWVEGDDNVKCDGPREGDILKVIDFDPDGWLIFEGYPYDDAWNPIGFRPIDTSFGSQIAAKIEEEMVQYQEKKELQTKND